MAIPSTYHAPTRVLVPRRAPVRPLLWVTPFVAMRIDDVLPRPALCAHQQQCLAIHL